MKRQGTEHCVINCRGILCAVVLLVSLEASQATNPRVVPGNGIRIEWAKSGGPSKCTIGPGVKWALNGKLGFITCGGLAVGSDVFLMPSGEEVGTVVDTGPKDNSFYSIVQLNDKVKLFAGVNLYKKETRSIIKSVDAKVGMVPETVGAVSHLADCFVVSIKADATLENNVHVKDMIKTKNACFESGDEGGPLFFENKWLGVLAGRMGTDKCPTQGELFYHKIGVILNRHSLEAYKG